MIRQCKKTGTLMGPEEGVTFRRVTLGTELTVCGDVADVFIEAHAGADGDLVWTDHRNRGAQVRRARMILEAIG